MKKRITLIISMVLLIKASFIYAQLARNKNGNSSPYYSNYCRVFAGCQSNSNFEIKQGELWAWGYNGYGNLGDGTIVNKTVPTKIGTDNNWSMVATGNSHTLGLKTNGTLWAWGSNSSGQLGDGTTTLRKSPVQVGTNNTWVSVTGGSAFSIALRSDGTLWAWGINNYGQLGIGNNTNQTTPVMVGTDNDWIAVSAGMEHSVALKADGTLWAWGRDNTFQLGQGITIINSTTPVQVGTGNSWISISAGALHTLAIQSDGTLWGWGGGNVGQLGNGGGNQTLPVQIGTDNHWAFVSSGNNHSMAIKTDGTLWATGQNGNGQLGTGNTTSILNFIQVGTYNDWVYVSAGSYHGQGVRSNGNIYGWGTNAHNQVGDGSGLQQNSPVLVDVTLEWMYLSSGSNFSQAIHSNGTLWAWGDNISGQLGVGDTINTNVAKQIMTDANWVYVEGGNSHSIGLKCDGSIWTWGNNLYGQLGNGTTSSTKIPVQIASADKWKAVAAGNNSSFAIKDDGTLWAWGDNSYGQLGDGTTTSRNSPVQIGSGTTWVKLNHTATHTLALKADGTLWAWGNNLNGQLGIGSTSNSFVPVQVGADNDWNSISAGNAHNLALKANGTLWTWGANNFGQLGDGGSIQSTTPLQIGSDVSWIAVHTGYNHNSALKADGSLYAWGNNFTGQHGNGTNVNTNVPSLISSQTNVVQALASKYDHSAILKSDRQFVCMTGRNNEGQLGTGNNIDNNTYVCSINACQVALFNNEPINADACNGDSVSFIAMAGGTGQLAYQWEYNDGNGFQALADAGIYSGTTTSTLGISAISSSLQNYIFRCVVSNSCGNDTSATVSVDMQDVPSLGPVTGQSNVCLSTNQVYTIASVPNASTYIWSSPSGWAGSSSTNQINLSVGSASGSISVVATNNCGTSAAVSINVNVDSIPGNLSVVSGNTELCSGDGAIYSITPVSNATSYIWTLPNGWSGNSVAEQISVTAGSVNGTISVVASNTCGNSLSSDILVSALLVPSSPSFITGSNNVCIGETYNYSVTNDSTADSYSWNMPSGWSGSSTTDQIVFIVNSGAVDGQLTVTASNSCGTSAASVLNVTVADSAISNAVTQNGNTLTTSVSGASYQWIDCDNNNVIISNAVNQSFSPVNPGNYAVIVSISPCIVDTSACVNYTSTSIFEQNKNQRMTIFPNPTTNNITVTWENTINVSEIIVTDLLGKIVINAEVPRGSISETISMDALQAGVYFIQLNNSLVLLERIVKY